MDIVPLLSWFGTLCVLTIIAKKSPKPAWREEHLPVDLRERTRRKNSSLSLGRLDLSSCYYLKNLKNDISQRREISCAMFWRSKRVFQPWMPHGKRPGLLTRTVTAEASGKLKRVLIGTNVAGLQYGHQNAIVTRLATQRFAAAHMTP